MFLPPQMSKNKKFPEPDSHALNEVGLKAPLEGFSFHVSSLFPFFSLPLLICLPPLSLYLNLSLCLHLLMFFFLLPLDQCPLCHQEMYKPRLSTPLLCALPGLPRARSLSMESTRDIRWAAPFCKLVHSGGQEGHCCYSIQALSVRFFF